MRAIQQIRKVNIEYEFLQFPVTEETLSYKQAPAASSYHEHVVQLFSHRFSAMFVNDRERSAQILQQIQNTQIEKYEVVVVRLLTTNPVKISPKFCSRSETI